jgi:hypothetical protein
VMATNKLIAKSFIVHPLPGYDEFRCFEQLIYFIVKMKSNPAWYSSGPLHGYMYLFYKRLSFRKGQNGLKSG